jgi:hypothetical protein
MRPALPPLRHLLPEIALGLGLFHCLAFVVELLAFAEAEEHFRAAILEIDAKRHQRQAFLRSETGETLDFAAVHEQLAGALRDVVVAVRLGVFGDVAADQPDFVPFDARVGFLQRNLAVAQALHLAADQDDAAFEGVEHREIVRGLAILGDHPIVRGGGGFFRGFGQRFDLDRSKGDGGTRGLIRHLDCVNHAFSPFRLPPSPFFAHNSTFTRFGRQTQVVP